MICSIFLPAFFFLTPFWIIAIIIWNNEPHHGFNLNSIVILTLFSCAFCPLLFHPLESCLYICLTHLLTGLFGCVAPFTFWMLILHQMYGLQIFSPILSVTTWLSWVFPLLYRASAWCNPVYLFLTPTACFFLGSCLWSICLCLWITMSPILLVIWTSQALWLDFGSVCWYFYMVYDKILILYFCM